MGDRQAGRGLFLHTFGQKPLSQARVSDRVGCHVITPEGSLISCLHFALDLRVPWIWREMEKYLAVNGSRFFCKIPSVQSMFCQLHSMPNSDPVPRGTSGVRGPICCLGSDAQAGSVIFATRLGLVLGTLSSRAQGVSSVWCITPPPCPLCR